MKKNDEIEALEKIKILKNRIESLTDRGYNPSINISDDLSSLEKIIKKDYSYSHFQKKNFSIFYKIFFNFTPFQRYMLFFLITFVLIPFTLIYSIDHDFYNPIIIGIKIILVIIEVIILFFLLRIRP